MVLRATPSERCKPMLCFIFFGQAGRTLVRLPTPPWDGWMPFSLLMIVGMSNVGLPFGPAQHHSLTSQDKEEVKEKLQFKNITTISEGLKLLSAQKTSSYIKVSNIILTFLSGLFCHVFVWVGFFLMNECSIICFSPAKSFMYFHALLDNNLLNTVCSASLILL